MTKREIEGSRAIVTGASSGIGREIALELARQDAALVVTARREERLRELAERIAGEGGRVRTVVGDLTEPATRRETVDAAIAEFGGLDMLVNNAGIGAVGLFEVADPQRVRKIMEVNFFSLVEMTRLALPALKEGNRSIVVNIGSVLGHRGVPYRSEYSASKFAVEGFSEAVRAEFGALGIDVLVVSPGATETEFAESVVEHTGEPSWPGFGPATAAFVARQTVRAIRRGRHEIIPHRRGRLLCWLNRLSPTLVDRITARYV
ncbi:MAG: SDR family oxidoreductase [Planctomycetes bacterium]|nr:SDR family oxidoreductase [Planctomycetota bacterium]